MKNIIVLASLLGFTACSEDPAATRQRTESSTKSDNIIEVVDTELLDSIVEELNSCRETGNLYEFSEVPGMPGTCTETPLLDLDCSESGILASSELVDSQKSLFSSVMAEDWETINAPDSIKNLLEGVSEHTVYACTGSYMLLDVHTYKVDRDTGLVENKIVKLHAKKAGD